jgi:hypothetical protein
MVRIILFFIRASFDASQIAHKHQPKKCPAKQKAAGQRMKELGMDLARQVRACNSKIDPRLCFLERAGARLILFEAGLMSLDEAVFGLFESYCPWSRERKPA